MDLKRKEHDLIKKFITKGNRKNKKEFSEGTVIAYLIDLEQFNYWLDKGGKNFQKFTSDDIKNFLEELETNGKSHGTLTRKYSSIQSYLNSTGQRELLDGVNRPIQNKSVNQGMNTLSDKEVKRLIKVLKKREDEEKDGRWKVERMCHTAMIHLLLCCHNVGFEMLEYKQSDFKTTEKGGLLKVTNENREVFIPIHVSNLISRYLEERNSQGIQGEFLFLSRHQEKMSNRGLHDTLKRIGKETKIEPLNIKRFKYTLLLNEMKKEPLAKDLNVLQGKLNFDLKEYSIKSNQTIAL